jgi:serine/threonine protein kinase
MAPEQRAGKECDARTDIYALGLILAEMATGRRRMSAYEPLPSDLPPQFAFVVERCVASDPDDRWQSCTDVRLALECVAIAGAAFALLIGSTVTVVASPVPKPTAPQRARFLGCRKQTRTFGAPRSECAVRPTNQVDRDEYDALASTRPIVCSHRKTILFGRGGYRCDCPSGYVLVKFSDTESVNRSLTSRVSRRSSIPRSCCTLRLHARGDAVHSTPR